MIKKALIGTAITAILGTFVFGRDVFSYAKTWGTSVRDAVKAEVPIEFEVERARKMIEDLVPDMRNCMHVIAEQQVDIENLNESISQRATELAKQKEAILTLKTDVDSGDTKFVYASRTYTTDEVKRDLSQRFERFKVAEQTLKREQQILSAREKALAANQDNLEGMLVTKQDLEVQIEQLEARMKAVRAAETISTVEIDNSNLSRAKALIRQLNKQLDVKEKVLDAEGKFAGLIPVEMKTDVPENIGQQVDAYFATNTEVKVVELDTVRP